MNKEDSTKRLEYFTQDKKAGSRLIDELIPVVRTSTYYTFESNYGGEFRELRVERDSDTGLIELFAFNDETSAQVYLDHNDAKALALGVDLRVNCSDEESTFLGVQADDRSWEIRIGGFFDDFIFTTMDKEDVVSIILSKREALKLRDLLYNMID